MKLSPFQTSLAISLLITTTFCNIHIWEPKNLRDWYKNNTMEYTIADFGAVPYGHSIYGTVFKASPIEACSDLSPLDWGSNGGTLIVLTKRGGCNFSQKVLNAQKIGAGLVMISNANVAQDVHQIFPIERTKERLDQIKIPSVLINKKDADKLIEILDDGAAGKVELAIQFQLKKSGDKSQVRFVIAVDDYRSYDSVLLVLENMKPFREYIDLKVHYKIFKNAAFLSIVEECLVIKGDRFCVNNSFGDLYKGKGLVLESLRQICVYYHQFDKYAKYLRKVRENCFDSKTGLQVRSDFDVCTDNIAGQVLDLSNQELKECMNTDSIEAENTLNRNHDNVKYFLINYSPLVFINGYYYKGNFDAAEPFFEALCNSFEKPPKECKNLEIFQSVHSFNAASLFRFVLVTLGLCALASVILLVLFYVCYRKKIRRKFDYELHEKISEALAEYHRNEPGDTKDDDESEDSEDSEAEEEEEEERQVPAEEQKPEEQEKEQEQGVEKEESKGEDEEGETTDEAKKEEGEAETEKEGKAEAEAAQEKKPKGKKGRLGKLKRLGNSN